MAYSNFKPTVWSKQIQMDLAKLMVFKDTCNTKFEGEAGLGKTVKIIGVDRPTVGTYVPGTNISAAQTPSDSSVYLAIDQYKYTNFKVDDVDAAQANVDIMKYLMQGSATALAEDADAYIASQLVNAGILSTSTAIASASDAKAAVDEAFEGLWDNGVKISAETFIVVSPWFYTFFKDKLTELYTNNVELIKKGIVGMYNGAMVLLSNNVYNDGTDDYLGVYTKDAIAFASGINNVEAYRPDAQFCDAVKVLHTYGAKVVRPKELAVMKVHE